MLKGIAGNPVALVDEDKPKGPPVVMIGYGVWAERFSGDPHVVGRTLRLDGVAHTIVGVLPPEADFPGEVGIWVPFAGDPNQPFQSYSAEGIGRLKPGVTAAQGQSDLLRAHQPIWQTKDKEKVVSPFVRPLREQLVSDFRNAASMLLAAVAILPRARLVSTPRWGRAARTSYSSSSAEASPW